MHIECSSTGKKSAGCVDLNICFRFFCSQYRIACHLYCQMLWILYIQVTDSVHAWSKVHRLYGPPRSLSSSSNTPIAFRVSLCYKGISSNKAVNETLTGFKPDWMFKIYGTNKSGVSSGECLLANDPVVYQILKCRYWLVSKSTVELRVSRKWRLSIG